MARLEIAPTLAEAAAFQQTLVPAIDLALPLVDAHRDFLVALRAAVVVASDRAAGRLAELRRLATHASELADLDVELLYDDSRRLLAIGYNVGGHRVDANLYDLLASEARLASFVAIAQGKLPQEHWFSLGRLLTTSVGRPSLLSWSGSMFEYLMPLLIMPTYPGTILDESYHGVVERQIEYGRHRGVPWGISESGYNKTDMHQNYQYRAFGVPGLGFKRGLADELVVAPYACALALMVDPDAACVNLRRLAREGQLAEYGFYEAVDYTAARLPRGKDSVTVRSYMTHHQGMTFLSLAYLLLGQPMQRRFGAVPAVRATELLLQERVPRTPAIYPHPAEVIREGEGPGLGRAEPAHAHHRKHTGACSTTAVQRELPRGGDQRRRWVQSLAKSGGDALARRSHVRRVGQLLLPARRHNRRVLVGGAPAVASAGYELQGHFLTRPRRDHRRDGDIDTHLEISVSPEDDIELRRVSVTNLGRVARTIELDELRRGGSLGAGRGRIPPRV